MILYIPTHSAMRLRNGWGTHIGTNSSGQSLVRYGYWLCDSNYPVAFWIFFQISQPALSMASNSMSQTWMEVAFAKGCFDV